MKIRWLLNAVLLAIPALFAYARWGRPRVLNWGATPDEVSRQMPGDEVLPDADLQTTRAVTIDAPPESIWPWLVQMGPRPRAGAYTYDWVERMLGIDIENSDRILPDFQELKEGEYIGMNEKGEGLLVKAIEEEHYLLVQWIPQKSTWLFALYPEGQGRTRLISRNRLPVTSPWGRLFMFLFMEWGSLIMERKMLLGIKERAERLYEDSRAGLTV